MAESYFNFYLSNYHIKVSSAGINALVGYPADETAHAIMQKNGFDISHHRARQLTETQIKSADLVLVMSKSQLNSIVSQYTCAKGKTFLLGYWQNFEIEDPYKKTISAFEIVYQKIELAWQDWKTRIL